MALRVLGSIQAVASPCDMNALEAGPKNPRAVLGLQSSQNFSFWGLGSLLQTEY